MPTSLKGAGWRSSRLRNENGFKKEEKDLNERKDLKEENSPVPIRILGKPSPRDDKLPHIHFEERKDERFGNNNNNNERLGRNEENGKKDDNHNDNNYNERLGRDEETAKKDNKNHNYNDRLSRHEETGKKDNNHNDNNNNERLGRNEETGKKDNHNDNSYNERLGRDEETGKKDGGVSDSNPDNRVDKNHNAREDEEKEDEEEEDEEEKRADGEEEEQDVNKKDAKEDSKSKNDPTDVKLRETRLPKELSSTKGAGYCKRVLSRTVDKKFPRVPNYGAYSNLLPESYKMPWKQDMKNRSAILANIRSAGNEALPNIEHNDFLFLRHREQLSPNVEKNSTVEKKQMMPPIEKILNPAFHHHTIKTKASQRKAIFPAAPQQHYFHPRLRHVTGCYACAPDYDE